MVLTPTGDEDFEALSVRLSKAGVRASAPAFLVGRSGAKHEFAFSLHSERLAPQLVVGTALSLKPIGEVEVLSFYAKVFDVSPQHSLLCVSPRLEFGGKRLAMEYDISIVENEVPKLLIPMATKYIEDLLEGREPKRETQL